MNILVACEESQAVTTAFHLKGHFAFSADILPCSGGHDEWHINTNVIPLLSGGSTQSPLMFRTADGTTHYLSSTWDMIIVFPPCTYLSNAGAPHLFKNKVLNQERYKNGLVAKDFFMKIYNAKCEKICIENPMPSTIYNLPKRTMVTQPYEHGHPYTKKTYLWLQGLPILLPTKNVTPITAWICTNSRKKDGSLDQNRIKFRDSKRRSKTFQGIADAMANQWG